MNGPLASLKIVEMVGLGPCPLAGQLLADLGAEVTVIDRRSGMDFSKEVNRRGKKSIALNLKSQQGLDIAKCLIAKFRLAVKEDPFPRHKDIIENNNSIHFFKTRR